VAVMNQGRVVQWGTPWEVYYQPRTAFMAEFVGSVNLVEASVVRASRAEIEVRIGDATLRLKAPEGESEATPMAARAPLTHGADQTSESGGHRLDRALLAIRPETLSLGNGPAEGCVALPGHVISRTFLGHLMRYAVRVGQQDWLVDQPDPGSRGLFDGDVVVQVNPRRVHLIPEPDA
jgi:ABC-type Fe3+/spermidine/putrescine transport system ATPase subunit